MENLTLSIEGRLVLECARACCDPDYDTDPSEFLTPQPDWARFVEIARGHNILPVAATKLISGPLSAHVPDDVRAQLKKTLYAAICHDAQFRTWMNQVLDKLSSAGVWPMVLKGPVLADYLYPTTYMRLSSDLDLMVHPEELVDAGRALIEAGYTLAHHLPSPAEELQCVDLSPLDDGSLPKVSPEFSRRHDYHLSFQAVVEGKERLVELHWKPTPARSAVLPLDDLWKHAASVEMNGRKAYALAPEHQAGLLVFHMINHGWREGFLRSLLDLSLMSAYWSEMDWSEVVRLCNSQTARGHAYHVLSWANEHLGAAIPEEVLTALRPTAYERWSSRPFSPFEDIVSLRTRRHTRRDLSAGLAESSGIREKAQFLLGVVLPPPRGLAQMCNMPAGPRVYLSYLSRPFTLPLRLITGHRKSAQPRKTTSDREGKVKLSDRSALFRLVERINTAGASLRGGTGASALFGRIANFTCARAFDLCTLCILDIRRLLYPLDIGRIAAGQTAGAPSVRRKADELCRYVYENIAYARSVTWLDPLDVLRLGYGDCKCQARLLQELLAAAGLEGRVVVGITGRRGGISRIHAWVEASIDGQALIYDPTLIAEALTPESYDQRTGGILDVTPEYAIKRMDARTGMREA
jgi:hypothetical protein